MEVRGITRINYAAVVRDIEQKEQWFERENADKYKFY